MSYKILTVVSFRWRFGAKAPQLDCVQSFEWSVERAFWDLMQMTDDEGVKKNIYSQMPPASQKRIEAAGRAWKGISKRVAFNTDSRGPYAIFTDTVLSEEALIAWAEATIKG